MNNLAKRTARLLPRSVRNFLRAPGRTLRWWWQRGQPAVRFSPATGWSFRCPPSAIEGAFHLQLDDPPQVAEFAEFMGAINAYRDPLFFDIGCHFGLFSFAVVDRCGKASRAVAIDPSGLACDMVRRIAETNGWGSQIQVRRAAAGSQRGEIEMIDAGATSAGYFVLPTDQPARDRVRVPVCTIDDLAAEVGPPDLIKVDVEGFEGEVLAGAEKTLTPGRCRLFLEMHNRLMRDRKADPADVLKLLAKFGYTHFSCAGHPVDERQILAEEIIRIVVCKPPRMITVGCNPHGQLLALAPMQDVTDLPFWRLLAQRGGPDVYWTEYFRVHPTWRPEKWILRSLDENDTGKPAIAQLIGNDIPSLVRAARELQEHPVAGIDLNLGCPAPVVYRKCAGGGLLREPQRVDAILGALREAVTKPGVKFSVKTRIGFDDPSVFDEFLPIFARHSLDLLTVHGRTVAEMYRSEVHYDFIRRAVEAMPCPVLANGNVFSPQRAADVLAWTGAAGLMIGRGCIRNPWLFEQIRDHLAGKQPILPAGREVLSYIEDLWISTEPPDSKERLQVEQMKRYLNFIGQGVGDSPDESREFLFRIRRATTRVEFFTICREHLDHDRPMPLVPHPAVAAARNEEPVNC